MSERPTRISACSLSRDNGPEVGIWIRGDDENGPHTHVDLTVASARELAEQLLAAAVDAENWAKANRRYAEVVPDGPHVRPVAERKRGGG